MAVRGGGGGGFHPPTATGHQRTASRARSRLRCTAAVRGAQSAGGAEPQGETWGRPGPCPSLLCRHGDCGTDCTLCAPRAPRRPRRPLCCADTAEAEAGSLGRLDRRVSTRRLRSPPARRIRRAPAGCRAAAGAASRRYRVPCGIPRTAASRPAYWWLAGP